MDSKTPKGKRRPCADCPWRKDAELGKWHDDHYREMAETCQRDGPSQMGCHKSGLGDEFIVCAGWALVLGYDAIGFRIGVLTGAYKPEDFDADGLELYGSWEEMATANGVETPDYRPVIGTEWWDLPEEEQDKIKRKHAKRVNAMWEGQVEDDD